MSMSEDTVSCRRHGDHIFGDCHRIPSITCIHRIRYTSQSPLLQNSNTHITAAFIDCVIEHACRIKKKHIPLCINTGAHQMGMDAELTGLSVLTELLSSSRSSSSMLSCPAQVASRRLRTRGRSGPFGPCQGNMVQG